MQFRIAEVPIISTRIILLQRFASITTTIRVGFDAPDAERVSLQPQTPRRTNTRRINLRYEWVSDPTAASSAVPPAREERTRGVTAGALSDLQAIDDAAGDLEGEPILSDDVIASLRPVTAREWRAREARKL